MRVKTTVTSKFGQDLWVSDFSQNKIHTSGCLKSSAALWRLNDNGIAAVESVKSKSA